MAEYIQEMAAVLCVFESGDIEVVSMHRTSHEAREELARLHDSGESEEWIGGVLVLADCGICHAHVDMARLGSRMGPRAT